MNTTPSGISGLDLVLGGGFRLLTRYQDAPSAIILIRGAPGTGKTLLACQIAASISQDRKTDVVYAAIEQLPTELQSQLEAFPEAKFSKVILSPFTQEASSQAPISSLFAGLIDLGKPTEVTETLESKLRLPLSQLKSFGRKPGVLIVDALSEGYNLAGRNLGMHASESYPQSYNFSLHTLRPFADSICKLAIEEGLCLILIEETDDLSPSVWSFAVDTVIELSLEREASSSSFQRFLTVRKHRYGSVDPGPHRFAFLPEKGIRVYPRVEAYNTPWVRQSIDSGRSDRQRQNLGKHTWNIKDLDVDAEWPLFRECVTAMYGDETYALVQAAKALGAYDPPQNDTILSIEFSQFAPSSPLIEKSQGVVVGAGDPFLSAEQFMDEVFRALRAIPGYLPRVVIGDFDSLRSFRHGEEIRRAVGVLLSYFRFWKVPVVLYETAPYRRTADRTGADHATAQEPLIVDFADVSIEVFASPTLRLGKTIKEHKQFGYGIVERRRGSGRFWVNHTLA